MLSMGAHFKKMRCAFGGRQTLALRLRTSINKFTLCVKVFKAYAKAKWSVTFRAQVNCPVVAVMAVASQFATNYLAACCTHIICDVSKQIVGVLSIMALPIKAPSLACGFFSKSRL